MGVKLEVADNTIDLIWQQQDGLEKLLGGLEDVLGLSGKGASSSHLKRRTDALSSQIDEINLQVEELKEETRSFQPTRCTEPLVSIAHVLDGHSSELDAVEARIVAAEQKLRNAAFSVH